MYDVIIVGGGAAGLSAAIYTTRRALNTLVLAKEIGGQTATALNVENYPGVPHVDGQSLMENFKTQAQEFGAKLECDSVARIDKNGNGFIVVCQSDQSYKTRSIILAFGKTHRTLEVPGEKEFIGKGVVYCATCDAPLFANKDVAVIGGGNTAADAALLLANIANKVYLIHRRDKFRAEDILQERIQKESKIELVLNSVIEKIQGADFVDSIVIKNINTQEVSELNVQGVFVEIGYQVKTDFIKQLIKLNSIGEIIIDQLGQTSMPGIFAAGDVTTIPFKQTVISAGQGAIAALSAYGYLNDLSVSKLDKNNK